MMMSLILVCLMLTFIMSNSFNTMSTKTTSFNTMSKLYMGPTIYGAQQTRSPLVNWYLIENSIPFVQKPPRPSNHPFGQAPFLTDDGGVEVFESGAILLYLADKYVSKDAIERASWTKWVVFANSELEELCFGPGFSGSLLERSDKKALNILEDRLSKSNWLVNNQFSVADVAVASYLNYVPLFFPRVNLKNRPNLVKYMLASAERKAFGEAFGEDHAELIKRKSEEWLGSKAKPFGIF